MAGICCYGSPHPTLVYNLEPGVQKKRVHSLRCRSAAPNNSNGMKPNPNPTPQLLTIAVNGLTELLRIFSSGNGRLDTENHVQRNEVSISSIDDIVMTLKLDYENAYFVTGIFTSAIYSDNCLFEDPTIKFRALGTMYAAVDACQVQPALKPSRNPPKVSIIELAKEVPPHTLLFRCSPEVDNNRSIFCWTVLDNIRESGVCLENDVPTKDCNSETSFVSATWKLRTFLRLPWRPLISVNGSTVYDLDDNFRIVRHAESWDISAVQAIGQIFTPSFLAERE